MDHDDMPRRYWFRAKRWGGGWGLPQVWEGWLFLLIWIAVTVLMLCWLRNEVPPAGVVVPMVAVLLAVCLIKGEPLRRRRGDKD